MTLLETFLDQPAWRIIDHTEFGTNFAALDSFAIDDTLCAAVGANESEAVARFWVHDATVVLGIQDSRLPFVSEALAELEGRGYHTLVRSSGGLAVVLDAAVLNVSLIAPAPDVFGGIDFGYETMWQLVREMILPFGKGVATGEIVGSYCPGRYDLSIGGRKFGGISQRRTRGGMAVQAFLLAAGSGAARAALVRHFYDRADRERTSTFDYPRVRPETMASLAELLQTDITVTQLKGRAADVLQQHAPQLRATPLFAAEAARVERNRERMMARNEKLLRERN